jgi:hypothetical protein
MKQKKKSIKGLIGFFINLLTLSSIPSCVHLSCHMGSVGTYKKYLFGYFLQKKKVMVELLKYSLIILWKTEPCP